MTKEKMYPFFQEGGSTPATPTLLVIRVVLLHIERFVQSFNSSTVGVLTTQLWQIPILLQQLLGFKHSYMKWSLVK